MALIALVITITARDVQKGVFSRCNPRESSQCERLSRYGEATRTRTEVTRREEKDQSMTRAARIAAFFLAALFAPSRWLTSFVQMFRRHPIATLSLVVAISLTPRPVAAQSECLACHADKTMQNAAGHSISVDGDKFSSSIHGSLQCNNCHADIKEYPHPDHIAKVDCKTCHADEGSKLATSVHSSSKEHPCTSCHGNAHEIFPKTDARSAVYPLNIPKTCGQCHSDGAMATRKGLPSVYPHYMDSIHGFALSKEGLLVAANCQSCHGSHGILSHKDPKSPTFKANIPKTCGTCHAKINDEFQRGSHGQGIAKGDLKAPVCSDCHTAHAILQPTESAFRMQSTPICGSCHKDKLSTYHDTFHSQLG